MEDDKRKDRNLAKAEAARRLASLQQGTFWIGTERTLTKRRHYNLVFLHARRKTFPAFSDIAATLPEVWPWGEMAEVGEVASRLSHQFPVDLVEAAIWKVVADAAAAGHLLLDLEQYTLSRTLPLARLPPDAPVLVPSPLPDTLLPEPARVNGKEPEQQVVSENVVPNEAETVEAVETAQEQEPLPKTANCTFSGELVPIDLKRFTDSGINLVECPHCGRMRSLSPVKGVLRFKAHTRRKQQTSQTSKRWSATGKTDWSVVGG